VPTGEGGVHVKYLENAKAEEIASTLQALAQGLSTKRTGGPGPTGVAPAGAAGERVRALEELCGASGLRPDQVKELERYGLLVGRAVGGTAYYDEEAGVVAGLAAEFLRFGVEARHLRMYKTAAEREAGFFEQVVMPLLKQRNPEARQQAAHTLSELSRLGAGLRTAMLRVALRDHTGG